MIYLAWSNVPIYCQICPLFKCFVMLPVPSVAMEGSVVTLLWKQRLAICHADRCEGNGKADHFSLNLQSGVADTFDKSARDHCPRVSPSCHHRPFVTVSNRRRTQRKFSAGFFTESTLSRETKSSLTFVGPLRLGRILSCCTRLVCFDTTAEVCWAQRGNGTFCGTSIRRIRFSEIKM